MKRPNCNAEIFDGSEQCQQCGHHLSNAGMDEEEHDFFEEMLHFFKSAVLSPGKSIGRPFHVSTAIISVGLLLSTLSLILVLRMMTAFDSPAPPGPTPMMPLVITFIVLFLILAVVFLIYFVLTHLMNRIILKESRHWKHVFTDFSLLAVVLNILYILFALSVEVLPSVIGLLSILIGFILSISAPIYVVFKYAQTNEVKLSIHYLMLVYYVIILTVNIVLFWPFFATLINNLFYDIMIF